MLEDVPMLPYDYVMCFIISLYPPVWKAVMNPRVKVLKKRGRLTLSKEELKKQRDQVFYYYLVFIVVVTGLTWYCL